VIRDFLQWISQLALRFAWDSGSSKRFLLTREKTHILQVATQFILARELGQVRLKPQHLHDSQVGADGTARRTMLKGAEGHLGHAGAFGSLFGRDFAPQPGKLKPLAKVSKQTFGCWKKRCDFLGHAVIPSLKRSK